MLSAQTGPYLYVHKTATWRVRMIYFVGALSWLGVIYGYGQLFLVNPLFFTVIAPAVIFIIVYHLTSYGVMMCYQQFDLTKHFDLVRNCKLRKLSHTGQSLPTIDIFLPICGEATAVVGATFLAVSKLRYSSFKVYVLDDKGLEDQKILAESFGFTYLSRENKGFMKKAGNLKHGYERSTGEYIVVFDADFAPHPDFITELLPHMSDPQVGIVQSPQYFPIDTVIHRRSALEYGAAHVQEDFYRFIQVARSRFGATICCGSNAIYRRAALESIGGPVQIEHSEDAYTGFELTNVGWRVKYIPLILAIGLCPDNLHAYFHQQHRWCSGSLSLMLSKKFWRSRLSLPQKICYISGFMFYLSHPVTIALSFQGLLILLMYHQTINFWNALPFIPCILFSFLVIPLFRITNERYGGFLARSACLYSYTHATITAFLRSSVGWQPTNAKRADVSRAYMQHLIFAALYFFIYMGVVGFALGRGVIDLLNPNYFSLLFWVFYNSIATPLILSQLYWLLYDIKRKQGEENLIPSFSAWHLKTLGGYSLIFLCFFSSAWWGGKITSGSAELSSPVFAENTLPLPVGDYRADPEVVTITFTDNISLWSSGEKVRLLQRFLNATGFSLAQGGAGSPGKETTIFGYLTLDALSRFQQAHDLPPTGFLGPLTRAKINTLNNSKYVLAAPTLQ